MIPFMSTSAESLAAEVSGWAKPPAEGPHIGRGHAFSASRSRRLCRSDYRRRGLAGVLALAERNAKSADVADRFITVPGVPSRSNGDADYDLILLPMS